MRGADHERDRFGFHLGDPAVIEAIDTAVKAANVEVLGKEKLGGGYVTVLIKGDVAAVQAAVEAGRARVEGLSLGKIIATHVIARPSDAVNRSRSIGLDASVCTTPESISPDSVSTGSRIAKITDRKFAAMKPTSMIIVSVPCRSMNETFPSRAISR